MAPACPSDPVGTRLRAALLVLHLDAEEETRCCLRALKDSHEPGLRTYLLDNGSCRRLVCPHEAPPDFVHLRAERNLGFAGGANVLALRALADGAESLLFLNNDAVVEPGAVAALLTEAARRPRGGIFGARILRPDGSVESDGERVNLRWLRRRTVLARSDQPVEVDAVLGCAMLVTRSVVDAVGLLDESYFAYFEEIDWCLRARRAGFPVVAVPRARVVHRGFGSTGGAIGSRAAYLRARNAKLLVRKQGGAVDRLCFYPAYAAATASRCARFLVRGRGDLVSATIQGAFDRGSGPPPG